MGLPLLSPTLTPLTQQETQSDLTPDQVGGWTKA